MVRISHEIVRPNLTEGYSAKMALGDLFEGHFSPHVGNVFGNISVANHLIIVLLPGFRPLPIRKARRLHRAPYENPYVPPTGMPYPEETVVAVVDGMFEKPREREFSECAMQLHRGGHGTRYGNGIPAT